MIRANRFARIALRIARATKSGRNEGLVFTGGSLLKGVWVLLGWGGVWGRVQVGGGSGFSAENEGNGMGSVGGGVFKTTL